MIPEHMQGWVLLIVMVGIAWLEQRINGLKRRIKRLEETV